MTYTVTETDPLDYESSHSGNTGTIDEDAPAVVTFTNTRNAADPTPDPDPDPDPDPTPATVTPAFTKAVSGTTAKDKFTFTLAPVSNTVGTEVADMPLPSGASGGIAQLTAEGAGDYKFGSFELDEAGTYVYKITENKGTAEGYTYDTSVYQLSYTVTEADGALNAETAITKNGTAADKVLFTNVYAKPSTPNSTPGTKPTSTVKTADPISSGALATLVFALVLAAVSMRTAKKRSH